MDLVARELGLDPAEVRRRNFVSPGDFPYTNVVGLNYDSGNYAGTLALALKNIGYDQLRAEQKQLRDSGSKRMIGIGLSSYMEICGLAPSSVAGATGFGGGAYESSTVRFHPTGKVHVFTGSSAHGQGHETSWAQAGERRAGRAIRGYRDIPRRHTPSRPLASAPSAAAARRLARYRSTTAFRRSRRRPRRSRRTCWRRMSLISCTKMASCSSPAAPTAARRLARSPAPHGQRTTCPRVSSQCWT